MDIVNIEALVAQGKIVKTPDIDPNNDYVVIGKWQPGNRKKGGDGNAYPSYAVPLSELLGGGSTTPITLDVIPRGTGPSIADGYWAFSGKDLIPLTACSNIGSSSNRVKTIFMCSEIDYATDLWMINAGQNRFSFAADGRFYGNATGSLVGSNAGWQINFNTANRANYRANDWTAGTSGAGATYFKSRSGVLGTLSSVFEGDTIGHQTYIAVADDNASIPLAAVVSVKAATGGVFPGYVAADWNLLLMSKSGVPNDVVRVTSEGFMGIGTVTPSSRLHVMGNGTFDNGIDTRVTATSTGGASQSMFYAYNGIAGNYAELNANANYSWLILRGDNGSNVGLYDATQLNLRLSSPNSTNQYLQFRNNLLFADISANVYGIIDGLGNFGIGLSSPTARLHVRGVSSTNADYALKIEDVAGNNIISARNDQKVYIKTFGFAADVTLGVGGFTDTLGWRSTGSHRIRYGANDFSADARPQIQWDTSAASEQFITAIKNDNTWGIFCAPAADWGFEIDKNTRNIGVSRVVASDTKFYIRGASATSADYALKVDNVANNSLIHVRNDGFASINQLIDPTSILAVTAAAFINGITATADGGYALLGNANTGIGVRGVNLTSFGIGVDGFSTNNVGMRGQSTNGVGGQFIAPMAIIGTGKVKFDALPTSSLGLTPGELWNNAGVVNIV